MTDYGRGVDETPGDPPSLMTPGERQLWTALQREREDVTTLQRGVQQRMDDLVGRVFLRSLQPGIWVLHLHGYTASLRPANPETELLLERMLSACLGLQHHDSLTVTFPTPIGDMVLMGRVDDGEVSLEFYSPGPRADRTLEDIEHHLRAHVPLQIDLDAWMRGLAEEYLEKLQQSRRKTEDEIRRTETVLARLRTTGPPSSSEP